MAKRPDARTPAVIMIALAVLAGVIYLLREGGSLEEAASDRGREIDGAGTTVAPAIEPELERESVQVAPPVSAQLLRGLAVDPSDPAGHGARVRIVRDPPPFVVLDPLVGEAQSAAAGSTASIDRVVTAPEGGFEIHGDRLVGYLAPEDPFLVARNTVYVDATECVRARALLLERAGVVRGVVRGASGEPLRDVKVRIQSRVGIDVAWVRKPIRKSAETTTGEDGAFRVEHVPAGIEFDLSVDAESFLKQWRSVTVTPGETLEVGFELGSGAAVSGRVRLENGAPVEGATIRVLEATMRVDPRAPGRVDVGSLTASSDRDGRFVVSGLTPGKYVVSATHRDYVRATLPPVTVREQGVTLQDDLVMVEGPRIEGRVVDASGAPVQGAVLAVRMTSALMASGMGLTPDSAEQMGGRRFDASADGTFESPPLEPGSYDLVATAPGHKKALRERVSAGTEGISIELLANGAIEGTVIAFDDAEPVLEFHVAALRPFDFAKLTDPETFEPVRHAVVLSSKGRFRLDDLAPGEYEVTVFAEGLSRTAIEGVVVKAGQVTRAVNFFLRPEAVIVGTVTEEGTNRKIAGARITTRQGLAALRPDPLAPDSEALSDDDGHFELHGLAAGRYSLSAVAQAFAPGSVGPIEVEAGRRYEGVSIVMSKGGVIRGQVTDSRKTPISGAMISASRAGVLSPNMTVTDEDGRYRLDGLAAGAYSVTKLSAFSIGAKDAAADMLRGMMTKTARVTNGAEIVLDFEEEVDGAVTVTGTVLVEGRNASGVLLHFVAEDDESGKDGGSKTDEDAGDSAHSFHMATTDSAGRYTMDGLSPGSWSVIVQSSVDLSRASRQTFEIEVGPAVEQVFDFTLSRTGFEGVVLRTGDRAPVPGARVSIDALDENAGVDPFSRRLGSKRVAELFADANGRFRTAGLDPGRYRIVAGGTGVLDLGGGNYARSTPREFSLVEGQYLDGLEFQLEPGASIQGTVVANGHGVGNAAMFFVRDGESSAADPFSTTMTDGAGAFLADGLEPGTYTVAAKAQGLAPTWRSGIVVRQNEVSTVDLSAVEGSPFSVVVVDASGTDVTSQCSLRFQTPDGLDLSALRSLQDLMDVVVDSGNRPAIRLAAGDYDVIVRRGESAKTVRVSHGTVTHHVIPLE